MADNMAASPDESLGKVLAFYAGMVDHILSHPERWLGLDEDPPPSAGFPVKALDAVRDRAFGETTPASERWQTLPQQQRIDWWLRRISASAGLAAATPRLAGALADRLPLQAALSTSASGLAVCATAREHGVVSPADWPPLLARVLFDQQLPSTADVPPASETEQELATGVGDPQQDGSGSTLSGGARRAAASVWALARTLHRLHGLLDDRPRGSLLARTVGKVPGIGIAGGWLDERAAIGKASQRTSEEITGTPGGRRGFGR